MLPTSFLEAFEVVFYLKVFFHCHCSVLVTESNLIIKDLQCVWPSSCHERSAAGIAEGEVGKGLRH